MTRDEYEVNLVVFKPPGSKQLTQSVIHAKDSLTEPVPDPIPCLSFE